MSGIPTYDAVVIPSHVQAILVTGAGGFVGQKLTQLLLKLAPKHVKLITTDVVEPPNHGVTDTNRLRVVKADLGKPEQVKGLFEGEKVGIVYALHGIMSGGSEVNFDLGYAVNVDSNLTLLKTAYAHAQATGQAGPDAKTKLSYVFVSSLAVYGGPKCKPTDRVVPQDTPVVPGTSYGIEKSIVELYVFDYGRRGWLDAKSVRLPTVCIRSGAPSTAASSFISGLIREPLQGQPSELPIASGPDDPMLDNMPVYITKVSTVIRNIAFAGVVDDSVFRKGETRSVNLPGISITPRQILHALEQHGGKKAVDLVSYKVDKQVLAICETWAGDYDSSEAQRQGFQVDSKELGYSEAVEEFKAEAGL